jgi:esterase/lipase superfamily enzyme
VKESSPLHDLGSIPDAAAPPVVPRMALTEPSSTADQGSADSPQSPWNTPVNTKAKDYTVLTVFYGTDRKSVEMSGARVDGYDDWFYLTAISATVTICLALASLRYGRSRVVKMAAYSGLTITVLLGVATTMARLRSEEVNPGNHVGYSNDRGEVQLGECRVSIPKYHEAGTIERPSILRLDFREDPRKHVVLQDVRPEPPDEFYASLKANVQASQQKAAFMFVHGYNVTFEDAARRTAQLAYDLKFDGAPIFFSWPSQGGLLQYAVDETNVAWAVPHLKEFLLSVARQSGAQSVHLIAHSMGNRALTSALLSLAPRMKNQVPMFHEVVLTAPDIDADVFKRDIAPRITRTAQRVTLYASSNDEALALSKRLHGYPRAGESGSALVVVDGVDTVDVSNVDTSLVGHSYYGSNDTVLADLFYVLTEPKPARSRTWLAPVPIGSMVYWVFERGSAGLRAASGVEKAVR